MQAPRTKKSPPDTNTAQYKANPGGGTDRGSYLKECVDEGETSAAVSDARYTEREELTVQALIETMEQTAKLVSIN
jgi:hypothetical protein